MREEGQENLTHLGHIKIKRDREKQRIIYATGLRKRLTVEWFGETEKYKLTKSNKGQVHVDNHGSSHSELEEKGEEVKI